MLNHSSQDSRRGKLWWVLILSSSYFVAELIGGFLSGSLALLADAGHMLTDVAAIGLGLFALWIAQRPADEEKTFGYYRVEILAALINGAALVGVSIWILFEAWRRFRSPVEIEAPLMMGIACGGLVVNLIALKLLHSQREGSLNVQGVWLHIVSDTLGSLSAIIGGGLIWIFGWTLVDPLISIFISLLILNGSLKLLSEAVNILLEGVPRHVKVAEIRQAVEAMDKIAGVHDLHVWSVSSQRHSLSAHVTLHREQDHAQVLSEITQLLKERFGFEHVTIQIEPPGFEHAQVMHQ